MNWYVLRTIAGQEEKSLLLLQNYFKDIQFILPKRRLSWRKNGVLLEVIKPLFIGYLFVSANDKRVLELDHWMRNYNVDIWFVKMDKSIIPLVREEQHLIKRLMSNGDIIEKSELIKAGDKVKIISGPLVGLEGIVEKHPNRNRRITIKVIINGEEKRVELEGVFLETQYDRYGLQSGGNG